MLLPNTGPFGDDQVDELRAAALKALVLATGELPSAVVDYLQNVEQRLLKVSFDGKSAFLRMSWDQFRPAVPSEAEMLRAALDKATGALARAHGEIAALSKSATEEQVLRNLMATQAGEALEAEPERKGEPCDGEVRGCFRCGGDPGAGEGCGHCEQTGWLLWTGSPGHMTSKPCPIEQIP